MKEARPWTHVFWAGDFSITEDRPNTPGAILAERIAGTRQITDIFLAALALRNGGRLVTFDSAVAWQAIAGAGRDLIEVPRL
jgi:predicted nucleic acid-binding protein